MSVFLANNIGGGVRLPTPAEARNAALNVPVSPFFPIRPLAQENNSVFASAPAVCGIERVYPRFPNGCERCPNTGAAPACLSTTNDFFNGRNYYNPSGAPFFALGTNTRMCQANRGCLDPTAANYNKLANTHCPDACVYKQPKVCVLPALPVAAAAAAARDCGPLPFGAQTAEQALYLRGASRALQQKQRRVIDWAQ